MPERAVAVIGAGKMGLPLACELAANGAQVILCDINPETVATINERRVPFDEPGLKPLLEAAFAANRMAATVDLRRGIESSQVVVVIVPVLLTQDNRADLSKIVTVSRTIAAALRPGMMISYETTLPIGTTRNCLQPILEGSGLRAGVDFDLVFSPERVKSLHVLEHLTKIPKIVGGVCARSAERAGRFYGDFLGAPVINVDTLEAAEFAKLAGMIYRDVNIALANELSAYAEAMGIDFYRARAASNTDGEANLLAPGIGVGGHCTPIYPNFVLRDAERLQMAMPLTANARRINDGQAERMLQRLEATAGPLHRKQVLILGLAFRPEVKEHTKSPAFLVRQAAEARGAKVFLHDPLYTDGELRILGFMPLAIQSDFLPSVVILVTGHSAYARVDFEAWHKRGVRHVLDGRCFWDPIAIGRAGISYIAPGLPITTQDGLNYISGEADVVTKGRVLSEA